MTPGLRQWQLHAGLGISLWPVMLVLHSRKMHAWNDAEGLLGRRYCTLHIAIPPVLHINICMNSWAKQMLRLSHSDLLVLDGVVVVACSILLTAAVEARVSAASCPNPRKLWVYSGSCRFGSLSSWTLSAALLGTSGRNVTCSNKQERGCYHVKSCQSLVMCLAFGIG